MLDRGLAGGRGRTAIEREEDREEVLRGTGGGEGHARG